jgi:hypothetical protein
MYSGSSSGPAGGSTAGGGPAGPLPVARSQGATALRPFLRRAVKATTIQAIEPTSGRRMIAPNHSHLGRP